MYWVYTNWINKDPVVHSLLLVRAGRNEIHHRIRSENPRSHDDDDDDDERQSGDRRLVVHWLRVTLLFLS